MKKLLLVAALGVAGLVSAENYEAQIAKSVNEVNLKTSSESLKMKRYLWYPVTTSCGQTYYLDLLMYDSVEAVLADIAYFNEQKCPTEGPLV